MSLKVVFISQTGENPAGAEESLNLLLQALPSSIEPVVVVFTRGSFERRLRARGLEVVVHPVGNSFSRASRYGNAAFAAGSAGYEIVRMASLLRRIKPDIVHTNTVKAHVIGIPAAKITGTPSVLHVRDTLVKLDRWMLFSLGRYAASSVIAVSQHIAEWYAIPNTNVIYNPFEHVCDKDRPSRKEARTYLGIESDVPVFGIVGATHRDKGHERFLRCIAALLRQVDVVGVIVGDARSTDSARNENLREYAASLGILKNVVFVPWLEDVRIAYAAIDVLCNCSTREPFGRTIVEAAELSIPSAMFDDCGASEVLADGISAAVSPAHDEFAYARRLHELATDARSREALGAAAREAVLELTPERHVSQVLDVYERLPRSSGKVQLSRP